MKFNIIFAMDLNRGIGYRNMLPWHIPEEMSYFKRITLNSSCIMGHNTFKSLKKPLINRKNIVISRGDNDPYDDVVFVKSFDDAVKEASKYYDKIFVIGGAEIYKIALQSNLVDKLYISIIHNKYMCDTFIEDITEDFKLQSFKRTKKVSYCIFKKD